MAGDCEKPQDYILIVPEQGGILWTVLNCYIILFPKLIV